MPSRDYNENQSSNAIFTQFNDGEKMYGETLSAAQRIRCWWQHVRVKTSPTKFQRYYRCPKLSKLERNSPRSYYADATRTLFLICGYQNVETYQIGELLKIGADPNGQLDDSGDTPLHRLIKAEGPLIGISLLLDWGAHLNLRNSLGRSILMESCDIFETKKSILIVECLLRKKTIDISARDFSGNSAGILAVKKSNVWVIRQLLMKGMSVGSLGKDLMNEKLTTFHRTFKEFSSVLDVSGKIVSPPTNHDFGCAEFKDKFDEIPSYIKGDDESEVSEKIKTKPLSIKIDHMENKKGIKNDNKNDKKNKNKNKILSSSDGLQYDSATLLSFESLWRNRQHLCHLMIIRKSQLEEKELKNESNRLKRVEGSHGHKKTSNEPKLILTAKNSMKLIGKKNNESKKKSHDDILILLNEKNEKEEKEEIHEKNKDHKKHVHDTNHNDSLVSMASMASSISTSPHTHTHPHTHGHGHTSTSTHGHQHTHHSHHSHTHTNKIDATNLTLHNDELKDESSQIVENLSNIDEHSPPNSSHNSSHNTSNNSHNSLNNSHQNSPDHSPHSPQSRGRCSSISSTESPRSDSSRSSLSPKPRPIRSTSMFPSLPKIPEMFMSDEEKKRKERKALRATRRKEKELNKIVTNAIDDRLKLLEHLNAEFSPNTSFNTMINSTDSTLKKHRKDPRNKKNVVVSPTIVEKDKILMNKINDKKDNESVNTENDKDLNSVNSTKSSISKKMVIIAPKRNLFWRSATSAAAAVQKSKTVTFSKEIKFSYVSVRDLKL